MKYKYVYMFKETFKCEYALFITPEKTWMPILKSTDLGQFIIFLKIRNKSNLKSRKKLWSKRHQILNRKAIYLTFYKIDRRQGFLLDNSEVQFSLFYCANDAM